QAQTAALTPARPGAAVEAVEHLRHVRGVHAGAVIAHADALTAGCHLDHAIPGGVPGGVVEQVVERAAQAVGDAHHDDGLDRGPVGDAGEVAPRALQG